MDPIQLDVARPLGPKWCTVSFLTSIAWLVPMTTLLAFNFRQTVVGAGFQCLLAECSFPLDDEEDSQTAQQALSLFDRNVAGVLQVTARVLELWFLSIACSLVYNILIRLLGHGTLPAQYLFLHEKLLDPSRFLQRSFWTAPRLLVDQNRRLGMHALLL